MAVLREIAEKLRSHQLRRSTPPYVSFYWEDLVGQVHPDAGGGIPSFR